MSEHQYETMDFEDLQPATRPVKYKGKHYVLTEASADAAAKYRNYGLRSARFSEGKMVGMGDVADLQPYLVSLCIAEQVGFDPDDTLAWEKGAREQKPVDVKVVRSWPERMVKQMFEWLKEVSLLEEEETEEALVKRLEDTEKKLKDLRSKRRETFLKNSPDGTDES